MAYKVKKDPIDKIPKAQFVFWILVYSRRFGNGI